VRELDRERFRAMCEEYCGVFYNGTIGTYNEKRLHLMLKHLVSPDIDTHEVKIGRCVADVFDGERIYEIQTASLAPLKKKLEYYISETEHKITVIKPFIASKRIVRVDKESGEVKSCKRSPKKAGDQDLFSELYWIADFLCFPRVEVVALFVEADEHRYSDERVRYRKTGKYDSELFVRDLVEVKLIDSRSSFSYLLNKLANSFSAKDFAALHGYKGRSLYRTLNLLCKLGLIKREKTPSGAYLYSKINNGLEG
jgi:hypothetical protein